MWALRTHRIAWRRLFGNLQRGNYESGGREGIRTPGLLVANEALSQLSYSPTSSKIILAKALSLANTDTFRQFLAVSSRLHTDRV